MKIIYRLIFSIIIIFIGDNYAFPSDKAKSELIFQCSQCGYYNPREDIWVETSAITIDSKKDIYIADQVNCSVHKFSSKGKALFSINLKLKSCESPKDFIADLTTDVNDNLLIADWGNEKIYRYDPQGKYLNTIDLKGKEIRWLEFERPERWGKGKIQIERLLIDISNNIYVEGQEEIIKLNEKGDVLKKWATSFIRRSLLDELGNFYFIHAKDRKYFVEKYDVQGNLVGKGMCGELLSRSVEGEGCQLPNFIDKNGNLYWFEKVKLPESKRYEVAVIREGKSGKKQSINLGIPDKDFDPDPANMIKFDNEGALYIGGAKYNWK